MRSKVNLVEAKWKDAEVAQLVSARAKLRDGFQEAKKMRAEGKVVPEGYIVDRNQLREALRAIRAAELTARRERRELRAQAKELRRKIDTKENAKALLAKGKEKKAKITSSQSVAATA